MVLAVPTLAGLCACYSCVEAFAILLLALRFLADAALGRFSSALAFYLCFSLGNHLLVLARIKAAATSAIDAADLPNGETFAISLQTVSF